MVTAQGSYWPLEGPPTTGRGPQTLVTSTGREPATDHRPLATDKATSPNSSGLEGHVLKTRRAGTSDLG